MLAHTSKGMLSMHLCFLHFTHSPSTQTLVNLLPPRIKLLAGLRSYTAPASQGTSLVMEPMQFYGCTLASGHKRCGA